MQVSNQSNVRQHSFNVPSQTWKPFLPMEEVVDLGCTVCMYDAHCIETVPNEEGIWSFILSASGLFPFLAQRTYMLQW